jgi:glycosyltransferase involved in cell wall biosynthesis
VPPLQVPQSSAFEQQKKEIDALIPTGKTLLLFQGAGINPERGVEELVLSTKYLDPTRYHLLIVGGGEIFNVIVALVKEHGLADRITIIPKVPFEVLRHITPKAQLGFTVDKPNNINHIYGLPNKIFDYLHAGVPVLSTRLIELEKIIDTYQVGTFLENNEPTHIAAKVEEIFRNPSLLETWRLNTQKVRREINWEKEQETLLQIFDRVCHDAGIQR